MTPAADAQQAVCIPVSCRKRTHLWRRGTRLHFLCGARVLPGHLIGGDGSPPCLACTAIYEGREPAPQDDAPQAKQRRRALQRVIASTTKRRLGPKANKCERCGYAPPARVARRILHLHHILPLAVGGTNEPANLVLLCANCHAMTHALCRRYGTEWDGPRDRTTYFEWMEKREALVRLQEEAQK